MRTVTTRQAALDLAKDELNYLAEIKNDPAKVEHFLNTLKAEKLIFELINLRYTQR